ncbi:MAG: hypothetical protein QOF49_1932 [Chloroflexota bacterium]|jgi:hypothetical protein|nr:hypothetical protein [Chloroflexota bacterium]
MVWDEERRPTLVLSPPDDDAFRATAEGLLRSGIDGPGALQAGLRRTYPAALVRPRELAGEHIEMWYVYRDGHWTRPAR